MSVSVAVLLAGVGSGPLAPSSATVAVLVIESTPAGMVPFTCTVTVRVTVAPAAKPPMSKLTTPLANVPRGALTNVVLAGIGSVTVTPVASWLPTLLIVNVYVSV